MYESSRFFNIIFPIDVSSSTEWNISGLDILHPISINWTENNTLVGDFWNTTLEYNPGDNLIWNYPSDEGYDLGDITLELPDESMVWQGTNTLPNPIPPTILVTMLQPNQKLTWSWPQRTSDGEKTGFGEYRIKINYDEK